jgi:hypothetical protein
MAQNEISIDECMKQIEIIEKRAIRPLIMKNYKGVEKILNEVMTVYSSMSKEDQYNYRAIKGDIYYILAGFLSLQKKKEEAIDAFQNAIECGWNSYSFANKDKKLNNIRSDERVIASMESLREKGDYLYILRQAGEYQHDERTDLPRFTYEAATSENLKEVRQYLKLDDIAGQGDDVSKIINLMTWVHDNIRYNGSNYALCEFDAIDIYNYHKATGKGVNCRHLAIALNEVYLAMGFKSRYVTCLPTDENDQECHVINSVYSTSLNKWLWIDPSFKAYIKDENGNLLSIEEVRERMIDGRPLVLNKDANCKRSNKKKPQTINKEFYLDGYMSKNLYWFQCPVNSSFNVESRYRYTEQTYILLRPLVDERSNNYEKYITTHDAAYFWEH